MRKALISIALATATVSGAVIAVPAAAQRGYGYPGDRGLVRQFDQQINQQLRGSSVRRSAG